METQTNPCEHRWIHFVDVATKAICERKCERCGYREPLVTARSKRGNAAIAERKSA